MVKGAVALEAQESNLLFTSEDEESLLHPQPGDIILHKKLRTEYDDLMVYVVKEVGRFTEGDRPYIVCYTSLYDGQVHFRPLDMFTTSRFCRLTTSDIINRIINK